MQILSCWVFFKLAAGSELLMDALLYKPACRDGQNIHITQDTQAADAAQVVPSEDTREKGKATEELCVELCIYFKTGLVK